MLILQNRGVVVFLHSAQMLQLRRDPEYTQTRQWASVRGPQNELWTGVEEGEWIQGCYLVVDDTIPSVTVGSAKVTYGSSALYMANPRDTGPIKPAIAMGAGAVLMGYASPLTFETESNDYKQFLGNAMDMVICASRADITDDDGYFGTAGALKENASSLVYVTYSPDTVTI